MLHSVEKVLLEFAFWFYSVPGIAGVFILAAPGIALLIYQFFRRGKTVIPGLCGLVITFAGALHAMRREEVLEWLRALLIQMDTPLPRLRPFFQPLESMVSKLVAPIEHRAIPEEMIFVGLCTYGILVAYTSFGEYKKTGLLFGSFSPKTAFGSKLARPTRSHQNELGSGDLANTEQIAAWTKPSGDPGDTALAVEELRGSDGVSFKQAKLVLPREIRNRHVLAIAKAGSGKTTKLILPILYNDCMCTNRSTIVIDSKPEMWRYLAGMTKKYNPSKRILRFNPLDTAQSLSWNILGKIEDDTDCKLIANTIIMATDQPSAKSDSPFFRNNALAILNAVMVGLLHDPNETLSMPRIHELVQSGMKPLCSWLEAHPHALRTSKTFVELARSGSQNSDTIMSELSMRLAAWDLKDIRTTTSANELDLQTLIDEPTLFIIELRESELEMLRPMANVIVVELLRFLTKAAERCPKTTLPRPVSLVIDEFASALGRLPDIHVKLNTARSRNISIVAAIQSLAQVKANYADNADSVIAGFSTKIFMPSLDVQDAEWASKETGQMTIRFQTQSPGKNKKMIEWFASKNDSTQEQVQQRAVLTPDEIGRPADNIMTFFLPGTPVFQGQLVPFYKIPEQLKRLTEFNSEEHELKLRDAPISYEESLPTPEGGGAGGSSSTGNNGLPAGITDTRGWSEEQVLAKLEEVKKRLDWDNTTGSARKWWEAFENENKTRMPLVLRLAEELGNRQATITEFFLAYVYSNTDNIQANLCYLDYTRLKKEEEKKKKEAAAKAREEESRASGGASSQSTQAAA